MYYNNTKIQIASPFHEDLFLGGGGLLSIGMWTSDYYELLELIGDDYEWCGMNQLLSLQSLGWLDCSQLQWYINELIEMHQSTIHKTSDGKRKDKGKKKPRKAQQRKAALAALKRKLYN